MHTSRIIIHKMNAIAIYRECTVKKVFIDGKAGTTGLRIYERLEGRSDITLLTLSDDDRKDPALRRSMLNSADIAFLCLPDAAGNCHRYNQVQKPALHHFNRAGAASDVPPVG